MIEIKQIRKIDAPALLDDLHFWNNPFLAISKHRLYSHYTNPNANDNDVILLLAYLDDELAGYMGVFIDTIVINGIEQKIGWLSTWWVHPKTKGSGIGREILNTMYAINDGKIGISQFTPSAKRVYDKSGYFNTLKQNAGLKAVLRINAAFLIPQKYPQLKNLAPLFSFADVLANIPIELMLRLRSSEIKGRLNDVTIEYLDKIDLATSELIQKNSVVHISKKSPAFFEWLKSHHWVQEAPLLEFTRKDKYEFSIYDKEFNIYLIKILQKNIAIGFIVLQKRNTTIKVLFAYYDVTNHIEIVCDIIKLHAIRQRITEVICYDVDICENFRKSAVFIYKKRKVKHSIISKAFNKSDFDDVVMNFGDGDCSFA